jgi:hypothetical protein
LKCPIKSELEAIQNREPNSMWLSGGDYIKSVLNDNEHIYVNMSGNHYLAGMIGKNCYRVMVKNAVMDGKTMHAVEVCEGK